MRQLTERFALVVGGALIALVLVELCIHVAEALRGPLIATGSGNSLIRPHPVLDHEHVPNGTDRFAADPAEYASGYKQMRTNNLGLRENQETSVQKAAGAYRILVLGDSQTDGFVANADTWPNVLEHALNRQRPPNGDSRYEVLNAGVVAYQPMHEYLWWGLYGRRLHADLVILSYFTGNDLVDAANGRLTRATDGTWQLDDQPRAVPPPPRWQWLRRNCRLCGLAGSAVRYAAIEDRIAAIGLLTPWTAEQRAADSCPGCLWTSLQQARLRQANEKEYQTDLAATEEILRRLRQDVESTGAQLLVMILPSKLQVEGDPSGQAGALATQLSLTLSAVPFEDRIQADVTALCARNGLAMLDVSAVLKDHYESPESPLYYAHDWHLNVRGNRVIGESQSVRQVIQELAGKP